MQERQTEYIFPFAGLALFITSFVSFLWYALGLLGWYYTNSDELCVSTYIPTLTALHYLFSCSFYQSNANYCLLSFLV